MKTIGWIGIGVVVLAVAAIGVKLYYDNDHKKTFKDANKPFEGEYIGKEMYAGYSRYLKPGAKVRGIVEGSGTLLTVKSMKYTDTWYEVKLDNNNIIPRSEVANFKIIS